MAVTNAEEGRPVVAAMRGGAPVVAYEDWGLNHTSGSIEVVVNVGDLGVFGADPPPYDWHYEYDNLSRLSVLSAHDRIKRPSDGGAHG